MGARLAPLSGLQNGNAPIVSDQAPLLDFVEGSAATETDQVIVQAAIADAGRWDFARGSRHIHTLNVELDLTTDCRLEVEAAVTRCRAGRQLRVQA